MKSERGMRKIWKIVMAIIANLEGIDAIFCAVVYFPFNFYCIKTLKKYKLKINGKHYNSSRSVAVIAQDELNSSSLFIPKKFYDTHEVIHKLCGMQLSNLRIARLTDYRTKMRRLPN